MAGTDGMKSIAWVAGVVLNEVVTGFVVEAAGCELDSCTVVVVVLGWLASAGALMLVVVLAGATVSLDTVALCDTIVSGGSVMLEAGDVDCTWLRGDAIGYSMGVLAICI